MSVDGASILIARGVISTASIARGCASGIGAIGAIDDASDETCRASGFGCAYLVWLSTCVVFRLRAAPGS